jgi:hypothetical protein
MILIFMMTDSTTYLAVKFSVLILVFLIWLATAAALSRRRHSSYSNQMNN